MKELRFLRLILSVSLLAAAALPASAFESSPIGFASLNAMGQDGTTGGAGGAVVTATTAADFIAYATSTEPYIIKVQGDLSIGKVNIASNKTIIGSGLNPTLQGSLNISTKQNIIIRNLIIKYNVYESSPSTDGITIINSSHHIWVDHCNILNTPDGLLDVTKGSDYVTVSWCRFYYTPDSINTSHRFPCLIGGSDSDGAIDTGHLHVTFCHNWWQQPCKERMPSVRYGRVHVFNNYYTVTIPNQNYCVNSRVDAEVLVENNYFLRCNDPYIISNNGRMLTVGNILIEPTYENGDPSYSDTVFTPPYPYTLEDAAAVPATVVAGSGVNKISDDITAPSPDPMTWLVPPQGINPGAVAMIASIATDENGIEYYFSCTTPGGHDSGWQTSPYYVDTGLDPNVTYTYRVRAHDTCNNYNETAWSVPASASPQAYDDPSPPAPSPMTWAAAPSASGAYEMQMTAGTALDISGVEYYFINLTESGHDSGWQDSPSYADSGLSPSTAYTYQVTARDKSSNHNETLPSEPVTATTAAYSCVSALAGDINGDCQVNLLDEAVLAEIWSSIVPPVNLVANGTFETTISPWTLVNISGASGTMTAAWDGTVGNPAGSALLRKTSGSANTDNHRFYHVFAVTAGKQYAFSGQWKGLLKGTPTTDSPRNWADVFVGFSSNTTPSSYGDMVYRKIFEKAGSSGNLNIDDSGAWDWEEITGSPIEGAPAGGVFTATDPYMVISFNLGGKAGSGVTSTNVDNISVTEVLPCPGADVNGDCRLNWLDVMQLASQWCACNRSPDYECWQ
jgi:pectate lyase